MTKKSDAPAIRFKGFSDAWEQRKLGELALFNPKDELPQTFEYVDLESVVGTEMLSHRTEVKSSAPSRAQRLAHTGDLFYQTVRPYQKNNYLFEKPDNNYVFSTGYAQMRPYVDGYFLLSLVQSERFVKVVLDNCTGTSYPAINANDLAEIEVAAPSDESEAQKIGTIFRSIDNLITLHQRKFEKLTNVKKSMLEKMFPQNGSSYPEIRFKGFTDPWEQRKVSDLAEKTYGGGTPTTSNEAYWNGDIPWIQSSDVVDGKLLGVEPRKWITQDGLNNSAAQLIPGNSIAIITRVGVGKLAFMPYSYATSQDFLSLSKLNAEPLFTVYACYKKLQSELNAVQGTSIKGITKDELLAKNIMVPRYAEQQQIGAFFKQLDNLITLHQRKCANLCSPSQVVFSLLFVTSTFSWEQRKLGDIADIVGGGTPSTGNQSYWDGDIDWYAPAEIADQIYANSSQKKITGLGYENSSAKMLPPGTVLFTSRAGIGKTAILTRKGCTNQGFQSVVPHRGELDSYFIFSRTEELKRYGELVGAGSTFVEVSGKQMAVMELMMPPTMREQQTIGGFFQQLDHLITLHQRKPFLMKWRTSDANRNQTNRLVL